MPRFVILAHNWPFLHWDFLLELEGRLASWRLLSEPNERARIVAEAIPDHRSIYLDYEGPVSHGRGEVTQWDAGDYELLEESVSGLTLQLKGRRIQGRAVLRAEDGKAWFELTP